MVEGGEAAEQQCYLMTCAAKITEENIDIGQSENLVPEPDKQGDKEKNHAGGGEPTIAKTRRTSARLQKDLLLTTDDRNLKVGRKRNLEGTNLNSKNSFSVLSYLDIMQKSKDIGVVIDDDNFATIDLMKDLEIARHSLLEKVITPTESNIIEEVIIEEGEEELSDYENQLVLTPRRKGKPRTRLSLSGPRIKKKSKENPCSKNSMKENQGSPDPSGVGIKKGKKKIK